MAWWGDPMPVYYLNYDLSIEANRLPAMMAAAHIFEHLGNGWGVYPNDIDLNKQTDHVEFDLPITLGSEEAAHLSLILK